MPPSRCIHHWCIHCQDRCQRQSARKRHRCHCLFCPSSMPDTRPCKYYHNKRHRRSSSTNTAPPPCTAYRYRICIHSRRCTPPRNTHCPDPYHIGPIHIRHRDHPPFLPRCTPCICCRMHFRNKNRRYKTLSNIENAVCTPAHSTPVATQTPRQPIPLASARKHHLSRRLLDRRQNLPMHPSLLLPSHPNPPFHNPSSLPT